MLETPGAVVVLAVVAEVMLSVAPVEVRVL